MRLSLLQSGKCERGGDWRYKGDYKFCFLTLINDKQTQTTGQDYAGNAIYINFVAGGDYGGEQPYVIRIT